MRLRKGKKGQQNKSTHEYAVNVIFKQHFGTWQTIFFNQILCISNFLRFSFRFKIKICKSQIAFHDCDIHFKILK